MMCIQPSDQFNNVMKGMTDTIGNDYGFVVAELNSSTGNYVIDPKSIDRTIDMWEKHKANMSQV